MSRQPDQYRIASRVKAGWSPERARAVPVRHYWGRRGSPDAGSSQLLVMPARFRATSANRKLSPVERGPLRGEHPRRGVDHPGAALLLQHVHEHRRDVL